VPVERDVIFLIEKGPTTSGSKALSIADISMIDVVFGASQPSLFSSAFPVASMSLA
jgi:hypothetical protein